MSAEMSMDEKRETGRRPSSVMPSRLVFGLCTFDEPNPGLGLLVYPDGIRLYGEGERHLRDDPVFYFRTPFLGQEVLGDLMAFFAVSDPGARFRIPTDEDFWLETRSEGEHFHYLNFVSPMYAAEEGGVYLDDEQSCGMHGGRVAMRKGDFRAFLLVLGQIASEMSPGRARGLGLRRRMRELRRLGEARQERLRFERERAADERRSKDVVGLGPYGVCKHWMEGIDWTTSNAVWRDRLDADEGLLPWKSRLSDEQFSLYAFLRECPGWWNPEQRRWLVQGFRIVLCGMGTADWPLERLGRVMGELRSVGLVSPDGSGDRYPMSACPSCGGEGGQHREDRRPCEALPSNAPTLSLWSGATVAVEGS